MMDQLIARFPDQLEEALQIGANASIRSLDTPVHHVYVAGLGGSGIGADFVANFVRQECPVPYLVGKGYHIPAYIGSHSLCLASSYSGNTEETLASFDSMVASGARMICIASGGKLIELADKHDFDRVKVPDDWPSPRACLGYSLVAQLAILNHLGLTGDESLKNIRKSVDNLRRDQEDIKEKAGRIAQLLHGKLPVIYGTDQLSPVLVRFRQQVNENAKSLCWHHVIPEMNHNELVGWRDRNNDLGVIYFRSRDDFYRNQTRIEINKEIISRYTDTIIEVYAKGETHIEQTMYLVQLGDWISWHLSQLRGMDSIEVDVIDYLKSELAKTSKV